MAANNHYLIDGNSETKLFRSANVGGIHFVGHMLYDSLGSYALTVNQYGAAKVILSDAAGGVVSPTSQNEDSPANTTDPGIPYLAVHRAAKVQQTNDGDYAFVNQNQYGDLYVDGGQSFTITTTPTVNAAVYPADTVLGTKQTLEGAARASGAGGVLTGITFIAEDVGADGWAASDVEVILFKSNPAGTYTNNTAIATALSAADAKLMIDSIVLDTKSALGNVSMLKATNINMPFVCSGSANLYSVMINRGGTTPEANVTVVYHMIRD